jgi:hypothetical protein
MLIHPSFLLFILNTIVITFSQFFENMMSLTQSTVRRNPRRNIFNPKVAKDHKLSNQRKNSDVESVAKGFTSRVFLSPIKASQLANQYGIDLPEEGEEKSINSNSGQVITKLGGKFYLSK